MAYVYVHLRNDTGKPFYIGIGNRANYVRAFNTNRRNPHWKNIVRKAGFHYKILLDNVSWKCACEVEKVLISLYGRKKDGGILCNIADGGQEGNTWSKAGCKMSKEAKARMSEAKKGINTNTREHLERIGKLNRRKAWYTNGKNKNIKVLKHNVPIGFYRGYYDFKNTLQAKLKRKKRRELKKLSITKYWFNDGENESLLTLQEGIYNNLRLGRVTVIKGYTWTEEQKRLIGIQASERNKGRIWINNGSIQKMVKGEVPKGFVKGRLDRIKGFNC